MAYKPLPPEIEAKYQGTSFIRLYNGPDGDFYIPNLLNIIQMDDETYRDLIGGVRIRDRQPGDGQPPYTCPEKMRVWVKIDTNENVVIDYIFVDARIPVCNEHWFNIADIISLAPSNWSHEMKCRYPSAAPSVVYPARD